MSDGALQPALPKHMYVDESTTADYLVVCAEVASADVSASRAAMRALLLPGQRSVHMKNERNRASQILSTIVDLKPRVLIYRVARQTPPMHRSPTTTGGVTRSHCSGSHTRPGGPGRVATARGDSLSRSSL